jgi:hypothetical protein
VSCYRRQWSTEHHFSLRFRKTFISRIDEQNDRLTVTTAGAVRCQHAAEDLGSIQETEQTSHETSHGDVITCTNLVYPYESFPAAAHLPQRNDDASSTSAFVCPSLFLWTCALLALNSKFSNFISKIRSWKPFDTIGCVIIVQKVTWYVCRR